jgi:hypothetical protein
MRRFEIEIHGTAIIELDEKVIDVVDDVWRSQLYDLYTPEEIAAHVAFNMIVNHLQLSSMDGWADQPSKNATLVRDPEFDLECKEMKG